MNKMKVKELMEKLSKFDPELDVTFCTIDYEPVLDCIIEMGYEYDDSVFINRRECDMSFEDIKKVLEDGSVTLVIKLNE